MAGDEGWREIAVQGLPFAPVIDGVTLPVSPIDAIAGQADGAGATWMYRFDGIPRSANGGLGSCHTTDVPFVFGTIGNPGMRARIGDAPSHAAAATCHGSWVRFVTAGDPGWPRYDLPTRATAVLADRIDVIGDPGRAERIAWPASAI